jgi:hypothetical protein
MANENHNETEASRLSAVDAASEETAPVAPQNDPDAPIPAQRTEDTTDQTRPSDVIQKTYGDLAIVTQSNDTATPREVFAGRGVNENNLVGDTGIEPVTFPV